MADPIRFYKGEETGIVHESYKEKETSLFKDQYDKALSEIGAFIKLADEWKQRHSDEDDFDINNVFAFIGERGTGKTSCMESVADMLYSVENYRMYKIKTIDPATLNDKTNILEIVIGTLFKNFEKEIVDSSNAKKITRNEYERRKSEVLENFQQVHNAIKFISKPSILDVDYDDISLMEDMSSAIDLKLSFKKLISDYLCFTNKEKIIIKVDDIDLQTRCAGTMIEQIRKYFIHPNVIILISVKLEQLSKVLELESLSNFRPLIDVGRLSSDEIKDMAVRYLIKLIPIEHRIYMPTANLYVNRVLEYYEDKNNKKLLVERNQATIRFTVTYLIYVKCRFLFYHTNGETSPIVPTNLRELRHLLALLVDMPNYEDVDNLASKNKNKEQFLNYFYNLWIENNIGTSDFDIIDDILKISDIVSTNKTILQKLKNRFGTILDLGKFRDILNDNNLPYNISISDVYSVLEYIKKRVNSKKDTNLIFFIESYYSIKLYECYDKLTDCFIQEKPDEPEKIKSIIKDENKIDDSSIRRVEVTDGLSDYEILSGGSLINTEFNKFIPLEEGKQERASRIISFKLLSQIAEALDKVDFTSYAKEQNNSEDKEKQENIRRLQLVEFFALCLSRIWESKADSINKQYRLQDELYYTYFGKKKTSDAEKKYVKSYESAYFDLGAFFFNITNFERAYSVVSNKLFEKANECKDSLYNTLLKIAANDRPDKFHIQHSFLSCAVIRNFEVLSDFINQVKFDRTLRSTGQNINNLIDFFKRVKEYKIKTYDIYQDWNEKEYASEISFGYAQSMVDALSAINKDKIIVNEFELIYDSLITKEKKSKAKTRTITNADIPDFNIDKIMSYFSNADEYSIHTVQGKMNNLCRTAFKNKTVKNAFYSSVNEKAINGRIKTNTLKSILEDVSRLL